jgi:SAM-dependent methyltransferase
MRPFWRTRETAPMDGYQPATYGEAFADVYDDWYADLHDPEAVADVLSDSGPEGRILELGVGTGRLAWPLAARGQKVFGIDASAAMLSRLVDRERSTGEVLVVRGDMARLPFASETFTTVFVAYNTLFNLPDRAEQHRCLDSVARCLAPGGALVVEAFVPRTDVESRQGVAVRDITIDRVVITASHLDHVDQTITGQHIEIRESGIRLRPWFLHYLHPGQIDELAFAVNLQLERRFGGWRGEPFDDTSDAHVSVYRRAPG